MRDRGMRFHGVVEGQGDGVMRKMHGRVTRLTGGCFEISTKTVGLGSEREFGSIERDREPRISVRIVDDFRGIREI